MRLLRCFFAVVLLVLTTQPEALAADSWWIAQLSGPVWILQRGEEPKPASPATFLPNDATLATGPTGRVILVRNQESMMVGPNTALAVSQRGRWTRVIQESGEAEFEVERQNVQHFVVQTPSLAAVVKGTHFTVRILGNRTAVAVDRGIVGVTARESGDNADITAGMEASVLAGNPSLQISGGPANAFGGSPHNPVVETPALVVAAAELSNGPSDDQDDDANQDPARPSDDGPDATPLPSDNDGGDDSGSDNEGSGSDDDDNSGHGNDDDHDDDDNSGHGRDSDS